METLVHPNEYFKRSYLLKNIGRNPVGDEDGKEDGNGKEKADVDVMMED